MIRTEHGRLVKQSEKGGAERETDTRRDRESQTEKDGGNLKVIRIWLQPHFAE